MQSDVEEKLVNVLAHIYKAVDWKRMNTSKISYDIFEHRLNFAKNQRGVPEMIQKLCARLSLQAPPLPLDDVEFLRDHENDAMKMITDYGKLLTLKSAKRAKELYVK